MKKLILILVVLIGAGAAGSWLLLNPGKQEATPLVKPYGITLDLPVIPVPILSDGKFNGQIFIKLALLFRSDEDKMRAQRLVPYLLNHMLRDLHRLAPHPSVRDGSIDLVVLEARMQRIADDLLGVEQALLRIRDIKIQPPPKQ